MKLHESLQRKDTIVEIIRLLFVSALLASLFLVSGCETVYYIRHRNKPVEIPCDSDNCGKAPLITGFYRYKWDGELEMCLGTGMFHPCFDVEPWLKGKV